MQSHEDSEHAREFMARLRQRGETISSEGRSQITGGREGEQSVSEWRKGRVHVRQLPPDEQGVLRISIGGGPTPVPLDYCVFRGDHGQCVDLLRRALAALESKPIRCPYGKVGDMELDIDSDGRTDRHRK